MTHDEALNIFSTGSSSRNSPTGIALPPQPGWMEGNCGDE